MVRKSQKIVADICLYGGTLYGVGWLLQTADGRMCGDGECRLAWSRTDALMYALHELRVMGVSRGTIRVFCPGGKFMSVVEINKVTHYGNLAWEPAIQFSIPSEQLRQATFATALTKETKMNLETNGR